MEEEIEAGRENITNRLMNGRMKKGRRDGKCLDGCVTKSSSSSSSSGGSYSSSSRSERIILTAVARSTAC